MAYKPRRFNDNLVKPRETTEVEPSTQPQRQFIASLISRAKRHNPQKAQDEVIEPFRKRLEEKSGNSLDPTYAESYEAISKRDATKTIDWLKNWLDRTPKGEMPRAVLPRETWVEGIHYYNDTVYKVQRAVHGSGRLYAKSLSEVSGRFIKVLGPSTRELRTQLSESTLMTKEQAAEFGKLYGMCANCGRTLTDETSIEQGFGPVCAARFL